jgi:hypothetical protein
LSKQQKKAFCDFLQEVKFPDGFASNISRCLNDDGTKVQGLKTHACHILLQRILPATMREFLEKDLYEAIVELGTFLGNCVVEPWTRMCSLKWRNKSQSYW